MPDSLFRIQQLASLARIDLNYVDQSPRDRSAEARLTGAQLPGRNGLALPVGVGGKLAGPAQEAGCATASATPSSLSGLNEFRTGFAPWMWYHTYILSAAVARP